MYVVKHGKKTDTSNVKWNNCESNSPAEELLCAHQMTNYKLQETVGLIPIRAYE